MSEEEKPEFTGNWILVVGSPTEGFAHIGPFSSEEACTEYANKRLRKDSTWSIAYLLNPKLGWGNKRDG